MRRVLITTPTFARYDRGAVEYLESHGLEVVRLDRYPAAPGEVRARIAQVDAVIVGLERIDAAMIEAAPRLKVISKHGIGVDNIDMAAAMRAGVVVANAPHANSRSVVELTLLLMLACARNLVQADAAVRNGGWGPMFGAELEGKTLGLIGLGSIGARVGEIGAALGMRVVGNDIAFQGRESANEIALVTFEECLRESDFLSIHVPLTAETRGLIDEAALRQMKRSAVLVNTSRGEVVDESALCRALKEGWIAGAGLDVFQTEPVQPDNPLLTLENVVMTPHMGGYTYEAISRTSLVAAQNVVAALETGKPLFPAY